MEIKLKKNQLNAVKRWINKAVYISEEDRTEYNSCLNLIDECDFVANFKCKKSTEIKLIHHSPFGWFQSELERLYNDSIENLKLKYKIDEANI